MLSEFTAWLWQLVKDSFAALWNLLGDFLVWALDSIMGAVVSLAGAIPIPEAMQQGVGHFFGMFDPGTLYLLHHSGVFEGLGMVGAAYSFKLIRKIVTLFQW